jgi:hypothetical protein
MLPRYSGSWPLYSDFDSGHLQLARVVYHWTRALDSVKRGSETANTEFHLCHVNMECLLGNIMVWFPGNLLR